MGRDISESTYQREQNLLNRKMTCDVDHITRAHFIQLVQRTEDIENVSPQDHSNRAGAFMVLRVCKSKHLFTEWKGGIILSTTPIIEGSNNDVAKIESELKGSAELRQHFGIDEFLYQGSLA